MNLLDNIKQSSDVKKLKIAQLPILAQECRELIINTVMKNGGHLASNLGVVDLVIGVHYVFNFPTDKLIFDVGHQCYTHKILTGRKDKFSTLRQGGGLSGFPKREESKYDTANTGHASTSLSLACGLSRANENAQIISILGDGAMTGGLVCEALNDLAFDKQKHKQIILLNDNKMSISENVGYISHYLGELNDFKKKGIPAPFSEFGLDYYGSIDGHNYTEIIKALQAAKESTKSILIHVRTKKGKGYLPAEEDPVSYHGYSTGSSQTTFSSVFGDKICSLAKNNKDIWAITAAMKTGVGLNEFAKLYPDRFVDVGIAEGHGMTMAAGLALGHKKPYFAVYSTFLQRAFDNLLHDVCLNNLPVTICLDRSGIVSSDGETHQGIYDVSFLRCMPNIVIAQPKDYAELEDMLDFSINANYPLVIRYPKGAISTTYTKHDKIELGKFEKLIYNKENSISLIASGATMVEQAYIAAQKLKEKNINVNVINARFVAPLDEQMLKELSNTTIITLEDNTAKGSFGAAVCEFFASNRIISNIYSKNLGTKPDSQDSKNHILEEHKLDALSICNFIQNNYED